MNPVVIHGVPVYGVDVDAETRCAHYHSDVDVIAIRFPCCNRYYPCHLCHDAMAQHSAEQWHWNDFHEPAVLCGVCGTTLDIHTYQATNSRCPNCTASFNPGCKAHRHLYFE